MTSFNQLEVVVEAVAINVDFKSEDNGQKHHISALALAL